MDTALPERTTGPDGAGDGVAVPLLMERIEDAESLDAMAEALWEVLPDWVVTGWGVTCWRAPGWGMRCTPC